MKKNYALRICITALIAAMYATISLALAPLSFGNIQIRIAEALTLLPLLFPEAILGVTIGCAITNGIGAMMGVNMLGVLDIFIGTFATFLAAFCTYKLKDLLLWKQPILSALMPVLFNALFIGAELMFVMFNGFNLFGFLLFAFEVGLGEFLACFIIGLPIIHRLKKAELTKRIGL